MENTRFQRITITINALQFKKKRKLTNKFEIAEFLKGNKFSINIEDNDNLIINVQEKEISLSINDWIIKEDTGKIYSCKPDIFELTYEEICEF